MESPGKINLIYVASIGRSGSTLLESMLGAHSRMATTGEVHLWPHELQLGGVRPCGSGKFVQEDPFWMEMLQRVNPMAQRHPQIHFFREKHNAGRTLRRERLREFESGPVGEQVQQLIRQYSHNNYVLFAAFLNLVEETVGERPEWIVDASKDPYRLLWFIRSGLFNVKVFHLVKNPNGFAYSVTKEWLESSDPMRDVKRLYYTARQALAWVIQNQLFSKIAQNHMDPADYLLIQYEQLASDPKGTFMRVCEVIGCPYEEEAVARFREGSRFTIAGNPMRYDTRGIFLDEKWKTRLPPSSRRVAELVTSINRAHFGYS
ncbi:MAG TPA: sulfotransferase [Rhodothermales bacterium]|nr:sulfotransferase [Rhodothermales bacterium]